MLAEWRLRDPIAVGEDASHEMATDAPELSQIAAEAEDIARNVGQPPGTAHLLLATGEKALDDC